MITKEDIEAMSYESYDEYKESLRLSAMTPLQMVREFATKMEQPLDQSWMDYKDYNSDLETLRYILIEEEFNEFAGAVNKENLLKELADLTYVVYGYAATFGLDLDEAVRRVHLSNLSKLGDDGKCIKREDGKVVKGPNYKEPNLGDLV